MISTYEQADGVKFSDVLNETESLLEKRDEQLYERRAMQNRLVAEATRWSRRSGRGLRWGPRGKGKRAMRVVYADALAARLPEAQREEEQGAVPM